MGRKKDKNTENPLYPSSFQALALSRFLHDCLVPPSFSPFLDGRLSRSSFCLAALLETNAATTWTLSGFSSLADLGGAVGSATPALRSQRLAQALWQAKSERCLSRAGEVCRPVTLSWWLGLAFWGFAPLVLGEGKWEAAFIFTPPIFAEKNRTFIHPVLVWFGGNLNVIALFGAKPAYQKGTKADPSQTKILAFTLFPPKNISLDPGPICKGDKLPTKLSKLFAEAAEQPAPAPPPTVLTTWRSGFRP